MSTPSITKNVSIAMVDDDPHLLNLHKLWLLREGYQCADFATGQAMIDALLKQRYDLLIVDWNLPDIQGDEILRRVRQHMDDVIPIIFVTKRDSADDIAEALDAGADDYLPKPVREKEMLSRINALVRRSNIQKNLATYKKVDGFDFDLEKHSVTYDDQLIPLTIKEFELALYVFENRGRIMHRDKILSQVWNRNAAVDTRTVDTHVSRIRKKLHLNGSRSWKLVSIYQIGYRLERMDESMQL